MNDLHLHTRDAGERARPPPVPPGCAYTSCYCEENIYLLAETFSAQAREISLGPKIRCGLEWPWDIFVVFISNITKTAALWNQKAREGVVVWDYHVVLVLRPRIAPHETLNADSAWVYDFDSRLPMPCSWLEYMDRTFPYAADDVSYEHQIPETCISSFRVIPAGVFLDSFASDRSHMLRPIGAAADVQSRYMAPPPAYPALCGKKARDDGVTNNLMEAFVSMIATSDESAQYGTVMDIQTFRLWLCAK